MDNGNLGQWKQIWDNGKKKGRNVEFTNLEGKKVEFSNLERKKEERKRSRIYEFGRKKDLVFSNLE